MDQSNKPSFPVSKGQAAQSGIPPEVEAKVEEKKFRVSNFAYQFKTGAPTPLVAVNEIYSPRSEAEKEFLVHQVSCGRILFS